MHSMYVTCQRITYDEHDNPFLKLNRNNRSTKNRNLTQLPLISFFKLLLTVFLSSVVMGCCAFHDIYSILYMSDILWDEVESSRKSKWTLSRRFFLPKFCMMANSMFSNQMSHFLWMVTEVTDHVYETFKCHLSMAKSQIFLPHRLTWIVSKPLCC